MVEPVEITLGLYDSRRNQKAGPSDQVAVRDKFKYVPVLEILKFMCRNPEICVLLNKQCRSDPDTSVLEFILRPTLCSQLRDMHYKFKYTMMILKLVS